MYLTQNKTRIYFLHIVEVRSEIDSRKKLQEDEEALARKQCKEDKRQQLAEEENIAGRKQEEG